MTNPYKQDIEVVFDKATIAATELNEELSPDAKKARNNARISNGAVVGAAIGYAIGGPLGGIAGTIISSITYQVVDSKSDEWRRDDKRRAFEESIDDIALKYTNDKKTQSILSDLSEAIKDGVFVDTDFKNDIRTKYNLKV